MSKVNVTDEAEYSVAVIKTFRAKADAFDRLREAAEEKRIGSSQYDYITWLSLTQWMDKFLTEAESS